MKKKIFLIFILFLFFLFALKLIDKILQHTYGLGTPVIYSYSKIYGYGIKPNQKIKRLKNEIIVNDQGMRSKKNWPKNKSSNDFKILFYGDSVTYGGSIVSNKDLFTEKICLLLKKKNLDSFCGNFGVNGYGLVSIIQKIKYKEINNEDLIVITLIGSDFTRGFNHIGNQPFWGKKISNYFPASTELFFIYIDKFRNKVKYTFSEDIFSDINIKYYEDNFSQLIQVLKKNNKKYIIFYSPSLEEINGSKKYIFFKNLFNKNENFYDLKEIKYENKIELYHDNVHLNKKGHHIYSEFMSKKILELKKN